MSGFTPTAMSQSRGPERSNIGAGKRSGHHLSPSSGFTYRDGFGSDDGSIVIAQQGNVSLRSYPSNNSSATTASPWNGSPNAAKQAMSYTGMTLPHKPLGDVPVNAVQSRQVRYMNSSQNQVKEAKNS